jgi:hypothetical protein
MITPLPTDVIVLILTNRPIIQPYMPTKIRPSPLSATTKAYQDFLIIIINHSTLVSSQTPHLITLTMLIEPLDPSGTTTWMREELRAFVFGVMKNLYLGTSARTRSFTPCVLLKKTGRVVRKME